MILQYLKMAVRNLRVRPLRSWLTILGIVIGIFLVVALISLSEGLKNSITKELRMMGGDLIIIVPSEDIFTGVVGGSMLTRSDIIAIEKSRGVDSVITTSRGAEVVRYGAGAKTVFLSGTQLDHRSDILKEDMGWTTTEGSFPRTGKREVLVGQIVPKEIFPGLQIGDELTIKGKRFIVSGVLKSMGNKQDDSMIVMDIDNLREITGQRDEAPVAMAKVSSGFETSVVVENIKNSLEETKKRRAGEDLANFSVLASDTVSDMVDGILKTLQAAIFLFASIAIIVGGIGIMNTMFTSVKERTKEIGILKAVGAKRNHINLIFLFESGIIGIIGGIGGVISGIGFSKIVELILNRGDYNYLEAHISFSLIFFGLLFSFLIGCLSGYFPARGAAKMEPVDALRYE
ncbi:MAG: ABC transporter permease [Minisyncoccales bacterium]